MSQLLIVLCWYIACNFYKLHVNRVFLSHLLDSGFQMCTVSSMGREKSFSGALQRSGSSWSHCVYLQQCCLGPRFSSMWLRWFLPPQAVYESVLHSIPHQHSVSWLSVDSLMDGKSSISLFLFASPHFLVEHFSQVYSWFIFPCYELSLQTTCPFYYWVVPIFVIDF